MEGGWTAIQLRRRNNLSFNQIWEAYKNGFGTAASGDFWIGNEFLNYLTSTTGGQDYQLMVRYTDRNGRVQTAVYDRFFVGTEADGYRLTVGNLIQGTNDCLVSARGQQFSTSDRGVQAACATSQESGWWLAASCGTSGNLNAPLSILNWAGLPLSQVEMYVRNTVPIDEIGTCDGNSYPTISCGGGNVISIIRATWGSPTQGACGSRWKYCEAADCTSKTKALCEGLSQCTPSPKTIRQKDPCFLTPKIYRVQYICVSQNEVSMCEGDTLATIRCQAGTAIQILKANYGSPTKGVCGTPWRRCKGMDVTSHTQQFCNGLNTCTPNPKHLGLKKDPCFLSKKNYYIQFSCDTRIPVLRQSSRGTMVKPSYGNVIFGLPITFIFLYLAA